jgi:hypothetical protein
MGPNSIIYSNLDGHDGRRNQPTEHVLKFTHFVPLMNRLFCHSFYK